MVTARVLPLSCVWAVLLAGVFPGLGQDFSLVVSAAPQPWTAGERAAVWLNVLNISAREVSWHFPDAQPCRVKTAQKVFESEMWLDRASATNAPAIPPGSFIRARYWLELPKEAVGQLILEFPDLVAGSLAAWAQEPPPTGSGLIGALKQAEPAAPGKPFDPARYFKEHLSPYEPFYFIAGPDSPNAKFQFSFKYQLLSGESPLGDKAPWLAGLHFAYTQTSLWDWSEPSAPFLDSSYKPELLYWWQEVYRDQPEATIRLDLQPGFQHESNGKGGEDSRSLNLAYLRPTLVLGKDDRLQLTLQPRAWFYVGDLSDNQDIARYRGYVDLRAILGWQRGVQLSAIGRMGDHADKGSVQLDLTYPMLRIWSSFSVYLDLQYFTGYGESLLLYDERSWAVRAGFSLYR
jgi:phospholipase A1/A2